MIRAARADSPLTFLPDMRLTITNLNIEPFDCSIIWKSSGGSGTLIGSDCTSVG